MSETTASLVLALFAAGKLSLRDAVTLYKAAGTALGVMEHRKDIRDVVADASDNLVTLLQGDIDTYLKRAEEEEEWCRGNNIKILTYGDSGYPCRLRQCPDAPLVLFVRGGCDLNAHRIINIIGTRKSTPYGKEVITRMAKELKDLCPSAVIVSGLAYGIDINAHRAALDNGLATVGVVAHGMDRIYPALHRNDADRMVEGNGAVVTEFFRGTPPEARNFLQRNRIIAGMADATVVVESAAHGGGLFTAKIAADYNREVFAIPGPVNAEYSQGCNNLIRDNKAALITSAADLMKAMMWEEEKVIENIRSQGVERTLFPELDDNEKAIVGALKKHGDSQINVLSTYTGLPINVIVSSLFTLEMKGVVMSLAGNAYHLIDV